MAAITGWEAGSWPDKVEEFLEFFGLTQHRRVTFERLSTGLKQRLALAKALINDPELLFLDEPTSGLDQEMGAHIREEIVRLNRETGLTMLLTTHNLREAEMLCSEVAFLKGGRLAATAASRICRPAWAWGITCA